MGSALDRAREKYGEDSGAAGGSALDRARAKYEPEPEKTSAATAGLLGAGQGASFGMADEGTGAVAGLLATRPGKWLREKTGILPLNPDGSDPFAAGADVDIRHGPKELSSVEGFKAAYRPAVESAREDLEQARKDQPAAAYGAEIGAALLNPVKLGPGAGGATAKMGERILRAGGRAATEGALYAGGASTADVGSGQLLKDIAKGGATGGVVGLAGGAAGEVARKIGSGNVERLEKRILNEAAEGDPGSRPANLTNRRKLEKAETSIVKEVIHGPDAKAVREALQAPPAEAIEKLQPIIDKVGSSTDEGYKAFEAAGKGTVDTGDYAGRLYEKLKQAKTLPEKRGIEKLINDYQELVDRNDGAPLSLRDVRAHTTSIQDVHESVLGVTPTAAGKLKGKLSAAATEAMDDTLDAAAAGNPQLQAAAEKIRSNNERMSALLTLRRVKATQLGGEATGKSLLQRVGDRAGAAVGGGTLGAAYSFSQDPKHAARNIALGVTGGALARSLPAAARAIDRGMTTRAIEAARGNIAPSVGNLASGLSRNAVQALARLALGKGSEEEAKAAGNSDQDIRMTKRAAERRERLERAGR